MQNDNLFSEFEKYASIIRVRNAVNEAMVTPQDALSWVEQIASLAGLAKQAKALADKADQIAISEIITELREGLVEVRNKWVDSQEEVLFLSEENLSLKVRIKELEDSASPERQLSIGDDGVYYDASGDGPFCTTCYDTKGIPIRLQKLEAEFSFAGKYMCNACKSPQGH